MRQRIVEYLGGATLEAATCEFITRCDLPGYDDPLAEPPQALVV